MKCEQLNEIKDDDGLHRGDDRMCSVRIPHQIINHLKTVLIFRFLFHLKFICTSKLTEEIDGISFNLKMQLQRGHKLRGNIDIRSAG
ncbi:hypothetical protein T01_10840, partial [Trichinella spiralis]